MAHDQKYGTVTVEKEPGNSLGDDEPVFILRGRDVVSVATVRVYAQKCAQHGSPKEHVLSVNEAADAMVVWQKANPDLVKLPD